MELSDNGCCFACGPNNPIGLHLDFRFDGSEYITEFVPEENHQGFQGVVHGGLISLVLDEVMARMLWVQGIHAVTTELQVTLRKAAHVGEKLIVRGAIVEKHSRKMICKADVRSEDGTIVAEGSAVLIRVRSADNS